jgi:hypothetical protein
MDATPETSRGFSRRTLLRGGLVAGLGAAAATVAVPALTGVAKAGVSTFATPPGGGSSVTFNTQLNWWWCSQCSSLFASDSSGSSTGWCLGATDYSDGHSSSGSWEYEVPYGNPSIADVQPKWNWCRACGTLFFAADIKNSQCAARYTEANGVLNHFAGTYNYNLLYGGWAAGGPDLQAGWTWCDYCQQLWHSNPNGVNLCPRGLDYGINVAHHAGSTWSYQLFTPQAR